MVAAQVAPELRIHAAKLWPWKWERLRRQNHWFDALYNACAAGYYCGVRLVDEAKRPKQWMSLEELKRMASRPAARELAGQGRGR